MTANQATYPVQVTCDVLGVSRAGFYAAQGPPPSRRAIEDAALLERIVELHARSRGTYGVPRIHADLDIG